MGANRRHRIAGSIDRDAVVRKAQVRQWLGARHVTSGAGDAFHGILVLNCGMATFALRIIGADPSFQRLMWRMACNATQLATSETRAGCKQKWLVAGVPWVM